MPIKDDENIKNIELKDIQNYKDNNFEHTLNHINNLNEINVQFINEENNLNLNLDINSDEIKENLLPNENIIVITKEEKDLNKEGNEIYTDDEEFGKEYNIRFEPNTFPMIVGCMCCCLCVFAISFVLFFYLKNVINFENENFNVTKTY
jgi:hypothetical protein